MTLRFEDFSLILPRSGVGVFFVGYSLFELPSNLISARVGARIWIARIMITWGVLAVAMMFVKTPAQFYAVRFLLGVAEAGFFPGVIYPIIWLLTVPYFAYYAMGFGYVAWAPTLIKGVLGTQNTVTTLVSAAVALVSVAADISSGLYSDRTRDRCALALAGLAVASVRRTDRPHQRDWINGWLFWTLYHRIRERSDWQ